MALYLRTIKFYLEFHKGPFQGLLFVLYINDIDDHLKCVNIKYPDKMVLFWGEWDTGQIS